MCYFRKLANKAHRKAPEFEFIHWEISQSSERDSLRHTSSENIISTLNFPFNNLIAFQLLIKSPKSFHQKIFFWNVSQIEFETDDDKEVSRSANKFFLRRMEILTPHLSWVELRIFISLCIPLDAFRFGIFNVLQTLKPDSDFALHIPRLFNRLSCNSIYEILCFHKSWLKSSSSYSRLESERLGRAAVIVFYLECLFFFRQNNFWWFYCVLLDL